MNMNMRRDVPAEIHLLAVNVPGLELIKVGGSFTGLGHQSDRAHTEPVIIIRQLFVNLNKAVFKKR